MDGTNFNLRGAMNTDNPDTAKIINGLLASVLQPAIDSIPDKERPGGVEGYQDDAEGKRDRLGSGCAGTSGGNDASRANASETITANGSETSRDFNKETGS